VLGGWIQWSNAANLLQLRLNQVAFQLLAGRNALIRSLASAEDWRSRQAEVRATLQRIVGPFPEKTPLNAQVLGRVKKDGYTIERVVFESMPKFYVTACLFIPEPGGARMPSILNVIGHTDVAFRAPGYQQLILNLVRKGFIVLAVDPAGQGERLQYYDPEQGRSVVGGATAEHSFFGKQCFLTGSSAARYFVWDGIRAIDYLLSRPEVDPDRIGVTGISGGGTQTSYIAALDDRVAAAAPTCYIAGFRRLLESIGPQDAEQNFNGGLRNGLDHADLLEVRAPRPTLVVSTTRDFFSIQGARETYAEAKQAFRLLGAEDNLVMAEDDFEHGYTKITREAIYRFFQQHLRNPGSPMDEEIATLPAVDITVTRTGQVSESLGGE
ncbi:MAG TPA: acetylxylan esterase, partial [Candidatus Methylomirabilis sp.]|nr:acetylxylan esterase [Candidatus Methylomirabilis sp.]